ESLAALTACDHVCSPLERVGNVLVHLHGDALVVQRAHRRAVGERVAEDDALGNEARELADELIAHVAMDEQPLARGAALAGAQEARGDGGLCGEIEVGVVVHGQFHGVITPMTPRGRRTSSTRLFADTEFASRPSSRLPSSAELRQYATSSSTSSRDSASGLPWSSVSACTSASRRFSTSSAT